MIARFATGSYVVTRAGTGSFVAGVYVPGASSTFSIVASVQPVNPQDLLRLPEGERSTDRKAVYTTTELRTAEAEGALSDRITYRGSTYEVESVNPWDETGGYFKIIAKKMGD
jgi:hypothetical protein